MNWDNRIHWVCRRKTREDFSDSYPQRNSHVTFACLWKTGAASQQAEVFPVDRTGPWRLSRVGPPHGGSRADWLRPGSRLGYPSPVCSTTGDAIDPIDRIAAAIDQLASDAQGDSGEAEPGALAARVAELWLMVSALDPELARRKQRYTRPADGAPSA
jgi:hypothetical protein